MVKSCHWQERPRANGKRSRHPANWNGGEKASSPLTPHHYITAKLVLYCYTGDKLDGGLGNDSLLVGGDIDTLNGGQAGDGLCDALGNHILAEQLRQ